MQNDVQDIYDTTRLRVYKFIRPYEETLSEICDSIAKSGKLMDDALTEIGYYASNLAKVSRIVSAFEIDRIAFFELNDIEPVAVPEDITLSDILSTSNVINEVRNDNFGDKLRFDISCSNAPINMKTVIQTYHALRANVYDQEMATRTHWYRAHLWGYRYTAILDDHTRKNHMAQHGAIAPLSSPFWKTWYPPNGYNCRCRCYPIYNKPKSIVQPNISYQVDTGFDFNPRNVHIIDGQYKIEDMVR